MFKNYIKIAWRSLWKSKFYTIINISGLAVGLATGIMLLLWVQNELSYDKFNKDYKNIYRLSAHFNSNGEKQSWTGVPGPLAVFAKSIPSVKSIVRIASEFDQNLSNKNRSKILDGNTVAYVDSGFFNMFTFPLKDGKINTVFPNNSSIVITESLAKKLFDKLDVLGETINYKREPFVVTGILKDFPANSSIKYDALIPMGYYAKHFTMEGGNGDWKTIDEDMGNFGFTTFVKLQPNTTPGKIGADFSEAYKKARDGDSQTSFQLQNIADIHLVSADGSNGAQRMVQIFMLVVILLLVIASINYVNLSTARSLVRAKEVGIRKLIGAKKGQLFFQFTIETILLFSWATLLAIILIFILMPLYNNVSGKTLTFNITDINIWKVVGWAVIGTLVVSSLYPAFLLSSFKPIESLKGKIVSGIGIAAFRKALVVFQFSISVILLVCTITMSNQMSFIRNKNLGYNKDYVFSIPLTQEIVAHLDAIKTALKNEPGILNVAASNVYDFTNLNGSTGDISWEGKPADVNMIITELSANKEFIPAMKIHFLEGMNFSGTPADSNTYILNETAVKQMGLKAPYIGRQISFHNKKGSIIGVVKDFNFQSLKAKISPLIFYTFWNNKNILYVRTTAQNAQKSIALVKNQYNKYAGDIPFTYSFLDKNFEAQYKSDKRSGILFRVFAGIAIFISCLGLFGLATYTAEVKRKEIGIRKVLGSSVPGIVRLISKDFLKLVIVAIIIATPISWWAMSKWLDGFAYRITIHWWIFPLAGILAVLIAFATVSFQAIKAALANPVKSLRSE